MFERRKKTQRPTQQKSNPRPASEDEPEAKEERPYEAPVTRQPRTTSYPQRTKGAPRRAGQARTTSYPSPLQTNHRGYDSIN